MLEVIQQPNKIYSGRSGHEKYLERQYDVTVDGEGTKYVGINLKWDYHKRQLKKSVPTYVSEALHRIQHKTPDKHQHAPAKAIPIQYGAKVQRSKTDNSPKLSAEDIKYIHDDEMDSKDSYAVVLL